MRRANARRERNTHTCLLCARRRRKDARGEMFSSGQRGVMLGIQSKLSPPSFSLHPFPSPTPPLSLFLSFTLALSRTSSCSSSRSTRSPTYLSTCLSSRSPLSLPALFALLFFGRRQVRSLYIPSDLRITPSSPFPSLPVTLPSPLAISLRLVQQ